MSTGGYGQYNANLEVLRDVKATGGHMAGEIKGNLSNIKQVVRKNIGINLSKEQVEKIKNADDLAMAINEVISEQALVGWTSTAHTGTDVQLYAYGPKKDLFVGLHDNTDLPKLMADAMNIDFGKFHTAD